MKYLILGNGAAGMTAAQKLREINENDDITVVTCESVPAYAKIMLPDYIGGSMQREKLLIRDENYYKKSKINLLRECAVDSINTSKKSVKLDCKKTIPYDRLLIAVGAEQFVPEIEGLNSGEFFTLNTLSDADIIKSKAIKGGKALIIGAGLTGIEISLALRKLGMNVVLIDRGKNILSRQIDEYSSKVLSDGIKEKGIKIFSSNTVIKVNYERQKQAILQDNTSLEFDMLVVSSGTKPNTKQALEAGIKCKRGILVNEYSQTSKEDVFAAGDVAELEGESSDGYATGYIWPNSMAQGKAAALNMAGTKQPFSYSDVKFNPLQLRDIPFLSVGLSAPDAEGYEILSKHEGNVYKRIVLRDDVIKGLVVFGDSASFSKLLKLFRGQTNISDIKSDLL